MIVNNFNPFYIFYSQVAPLVLYQHSLDALPAGDGTRSILRINNVAMLLLILI